MPTETTTNINDLEKSLPKVTIADTPAKQIAYALAKAKKSLMYDRKSKLFNIFTGLTEGVGNTLAQAAEFKEHELTLLDTSIENKIGMLSTFKDSLKSTADAVNSIITASSVTTASTPIDANKMAQRVNNSISNINSLIQNNKSCLPIDLADTIDTLNTNAGAINSSASTLTTNMADPTNQGSVVSGAMGLISASTNYLNDVSYLIQLIAISIESTRLFACSNYFSTKNDRQKTLNDIKIAQIVFSAANTLSVAVQSSFEYLTINSAPTEAMLSFTTGLSVDTSNSAELNYGKILTALGLPTPPSTVPLSQQSLSSVESMSTIDNDNSSSSSSNAVHPLTPPPTE